MSAKHFYINLCYFQDYSKKADLWGEKNWRPISPEKIFLLFLCWDDLKVFLRRKKFFEKLFSCNFWQVWRRTSKRRRLQMSSLYTKKSWVTFLFLMLKFQVASLISFLVIEQNIWNQEDFTHSGTDGLNLNLKCF